MNPLKKIFGIGVDLTRYTVTSKKIPASFCGFKIIHLSDFHCQPQKGILQPVFAEKPDIIVITGDMSDDNKPYKTFLALLKSLTKCAPVYMVTGNHDVLRPDAPEFIKDCRRTGAVFLRDEGMSFSHADGFVTIYGIDDPCAKVTEICDKKIMESLSRLNRTGNYEILLFHRANKLELFKDENFDLILSGHMHGGQVRLPVLGGIAAPKSCFPSGAKMLFPDYCGGRYALGKTDIIVNRGMGNPLPVPRLGNAPEVVSITLMNE